MRKSWEYNYNLAKEYFKEHGDLLIPAHYKIKNVNIGTWIQNQRQAYNGNKKYKLNEIQIEKLNNINMCWDIFNDRWIEKYQIAKDYFERYGNLLIPREYEINNFKLGIWVQTQRQNYIRNKLSDAQINMLETIGMIWDVFDFNWETNYNLAKEFYNKYGNLLIPINYTVDNVKLGSWIQMQRQSYKGNITSRLNEEKIYKLESIGMKWDIRKKESD